MRCRQVLKKREKKKRNKKSKKRKQLEKINNMICSMDWQRESHIKVEQHQPQTLATSSNLTAQQSTASPHKDGHLANANHNEQQKLEIAELECAMLKNTEDDKEADKKWEMMLYCFEKSKKRDLNELEKLEHQIQNSNASVAPSEFSVMIANITAKIMNRTSIRSVRRYSHSNNQGRPCFDEELPSNTC